MLVVLAVQLELQAAQGIDLIHSDLRGAGNAGAVHGSAAGQRAGHADLNGTGLGRGGDRKHCSDHGDGHYKRNKLFHFSFLL